MLPDNKDKEDLFHYYFAMVFSAMQTNCPSDWNGSSTQEKIEDNSKQEIVRKYQGAFNDFDS